MNFNAILSDNVNAKSTERGRFKCTLNRKLLVSCSCYVFFFFCILRAVNLFFFFAFYVCINWNDLFSLSWIHWEHLQLWCIFSSLVCFKSAEKPTIKQTTRQNHINRFQIGHKNNQNKLNIIMLKWAWLGLVFFFFLHLNRFYNTVFSIWCHCSCLPLPIISI